MVIVDLKDLIKEERRRYFKEWRDKNKDKVRKHNERYWRNRAKKLANEKASKEKGGAQ